MKKFQINKIFERVHNIQTGYAYSFKKRYCSKRLYNTGAWYIKAKTIKINIEAQPKLLWTFFEDNGANIFIPAGVNESSTICENSPKNIASMISI